MTQSSQANSESSFYLAFIVALHVATALALLWFFRADWVRIVAGFFRSAPRSLRERRLSAADSDERLAWLIVLATIPVGLTGVAFEHVFRTVFAKPVAASALLIVNGLILFAGERLRRGSERLPSSVETPVGAGDPQDPAYVERTPGGARTAEDIAAAYASDVRISPFPTSRGC